MASEYDPSVYGVDDFVDAVDDYDNQKPIPEDSRRVLFQRLWTDDDEIELLTGFLNYTSQRGGGVYWSSHHHDTTAFYEEIKNKLQFEFNKNQLVEKLRRLKKKYRTVMGKIESGKDYAFKTPHDHALFEISKRIWYQPETTRVLENDEFNVPLVDYDARPKKRSRPEESLEFDQVENSVPGLIEETVRSCLTPVLTELVKSVTSSSRGVGGIRPMGFELGGSGMLGYVFGNDTGNVTGDKWRKQYLLELEVYSKRLELVQDQIKSKMEELTKSL